jgi:hypothetical protein
MLWPLQGAGSSGLAAAPSSGPTAAGLYSPTINNNALGALPLLAPIKLAERLQFAQGTAQGAAGVALNVLEQPARRSTAQLKQARKRTHSTLKQAGSIEPAAGSSAGDPAPKRARARKPAHKSEPTRTHVWHNCMPFQHSAVGKQWRSS